MRSQFLCMCVQIVCEKHQQPSRCVYTRKLARMHKCVWDENNALATNTKDMCRKKGQKNFWS